MKIAGGVAVSLLAVIGVFQVALALGAPLGRAAWGGRYDRGLPAPLRVASGVTGVLVYPAIIVMLLSASGLIDADLVPWDPGAVIWGLAGLFLVGTILSTMSRSPVERWWGPVLARYLYLLRGHCDQRMNPIRSKHGEG